MPLLLTLRRGFATLAATLLVAGLLPQPAQAQPAQAQPAHAPLAQHAHPQPTQAAQASDAPLVPVIVQLEDAPLASYRGGLPGLAPTSPEATGRRRVDPTSADSRRYLAHLDGRFDRFERELGSLVPGAAVTRRFDVVLGGVAAQVPADRVDVLRRMPGVTSVTLDEPRPVTTDRAPGFIGAPTAWSDLGGQGDAGEGVIVGVLDTGIWPEHASFSDPDPTGEAYPTPPPPPGGGTRGCDFGSSDPDDPDFTCNDKLVGAYRFMSQWDSQVSAGVHDDTGNFESARDNDGHGTHTASTAAGNREVDAVMGGHSLATVSGIAPRAHVIAYKVCGTEADSGTAVCYQGDAVDAVQQAVLDGVDVINFSIGGGTDPYSDPVEQAFQDAYAAGVLTAASAGNSGPTADTVSHRGPWTLTVGASTHDRWFSSTISLTGVGTTTTLELTGASITEGISTPTAVVDAADHGNELCEEGVWSPNEFSGEIVACRRGSIPRVAKSAAVEAAGGGGMLLYNVFGGFAGTNPDLHAVPSIHLDAAAGEDLIDFLDAHAGVTGTFPGGSGSLTRQGDVMAWFSSRGGSGQTLGISKPDVTAPGVEILAGYTPAPNHSFHPEGGDFAIASGTSMSGPMTAGAAALLTQLHPDWTPGRIRSALMTTATGEVTNHDGVGTTAFDRGTGRIDLTVAGDPGLTFDESAADYDTLQDRLWDANHPSLYHPAADGTLRVQRTVRSHLPSASTWTTSVVEPAGVKLEVPSSIEVAADGTTSFEIAANVRALGENAVRHARLKLTDGEGRVVAFPITLVKGKDGSNSAPVASSATIETQTDTAVDIALEATDADDDVLDYAVETPPSHGTLSGTAPDLTYTPDSGYSGADSFDFTVDDGAASDTATVSIEVVAGEADLSLTLADTPDPVAVGDTVTYTTTVTNDGPDDATGTTLTLDLPSEVSSPTVTAGSCTVSSTSPEVTCDVGTLTSGSTATVEVEATAATRASAAKATADASSDQADPTANTVTTTTKIVEPPGAPADVSATAGDRQATVEWTAPADDGGSAITSYTVTSSPGGKTATVGGSKRTATITGLTNGTTYRFTVTATNSAGTGPGATSNQVMPGVRLDGDPSSTERVDHGAPIAAAVEMSRSRFAHDAAGHVVLSRVDTFADSLAGAALTDRGPLLLTPTEQLAPATRQEIDRALPGGGTVYILGGTAAVSQDVEDELSSAGYDVRRLFGPSRLETALEVADQVRRLHPGEDRVALARAYGTDDNPTAGWADSVTGGAWAAEAGVPVVLSTTEALSGPTAGWLAEARPSETILFGGTAALSDAVEDAVPSPRRVAGPARDFTAVAIARDLWGAPMTGRRDFIIIDGFRADGWAYGLAAAGLASDLDAPLLLVEPDGVPAATEDAVSHCGSPVVDLLLVGSTRVISGAVADRLDDLDGSAC